MLHGKLQNMLSAVVTVWAPRAPGAMDAEVLEWDKEIVLDATPGCTVRGWLPASLSKLTSLEALEVTSVLLYFLVPGCGVSVQDASGESKTALRCPSLAPILNLPISFHVSFWTCPGCASR